MSLLDEFKTGSIWYNKLNHDRCIVLKINKVGTVSVRLPNNTSFEYLPQELESERVVKDRDDALSEKIRQLNEANRKKLEYF